MVSINVIEARKNKISVGKTLLAVWLTLSLFLTTNIEVRSAPNLVSPPAEVLKITHGAHIRPTLEYGQEITAFNNLAQKDIGLLMYFLDWSVAGQNGFYFDTYLSYKIQQTFGENGPVTILTWQPMNGKKPGCTKDYNRYMPPDDIIAGKCDNYIRNFAREVKARSERYLIRFAHEMNIMDSPWWPGHYNQDSSAYIQMYRHVYDVFMSENVPNVEWVWSPSVGSWPNEPWNEKNNYYPGDDVVDWVGLSGLNWNTPWYWFSDIYDSDLYGYAIQDLTCRYAKPQLLIEFGSVDGAGSQRKTTWITDAYQKIPEFPFIRSVLWYNNQGSVADFRVTTVTGANYPPLNVYPLPQSSGAWTGAYAQAVSSSVYNSTFHSLDTATPPTTYCGNGEPVYQATPTFTSIYPGQQSIHQFIGMLNPQDMALSLQFPPGSNLSGTFSLNPLPTPWGASLLKVQSSPNTPAGSYPVVIRSNGIDLATVTINVSQNVIFIPFVKK